MKYLFVLGLVVSTAVIGLSFLIEDSPPASRIDWRVFAMSAGITVFLSTLGLALWFLPVLVALSRIRAKRVDVAFVSQRNQVTMIGLKSLVATSEGSWRSIPTYFVVAMSEQGVEFWRPMPFEKFAELSWDHVRGVEVVDVAIPKTVAGLEVSTRLVAPSDSIVLIPSKTGLELFAMNRAEAARLRDQIANVATKSGR